jgi:mono/diheme cytochrome c family protein
MSGIRGTVPFHWLMTVTTCIARAAIAVALLGTLAPAWTEARQQARPTTSTETSIPPTPAGNADTGRQTYLKKGCYACHGREGQGSPTTGPRLGPGPAPLLTFTRYVRAPRGQMPPYTDKVISDAELADVYAFLKARPRPTAIDSILSK